MYRLRFVFPFICQCFYLLAIMNNAAMNMGILLESLLSVLLGIYPEVELLDHMAALFLIF